MRPVKIKSKKIIASQITSRSLEHFIHVSIELPDETEEHERVSLRELKVDDVLVALAVARVDLYVELYLLFAEPVLLLLLRVRSELGHHLARVGFAGQLSPAFLLLGAQHALYAVLDALDAELDPEHLEHL